MSHLLKLGAIGASVAQPPEDRPNHSDKLLKGHGVIVGKSANRLIDNPLQLVDNMLFRSRGCRERTQACNHAGLTGTKASKINPQLTEVFQDAETIQDLFDPSHR
jgi:hypothetical protein